MGGHCIPQKFTTLRSRKDCVQGKRVEWGVTLKEAVDMQNSFITEVIGDNEIDYDDKKKYIYNGRVLSEAVHKDPVIQFYFNAALIMNNLGVPKNPTFPKYKNQDMFVTNNGAAGIICALGVVADLALKAAWYYKWQKYRRIRPEGFGIAIHNVKNDMSKNKDYCLDTQFLDNPIFSKINYINKNASSEDDYLYLLPMAYPEGSPSHPAYPAGHAVVAGACATILKIFYDGCQKWNYPVYESDSSGEELQDLSENLSNPFDMTVNGEINKLASNIAIGRDWAGVHYRSDGVKGILLGEQVAIEYMKDNLGMMFETRDEHCPVTISFKGFDGCPVYITANKKH
jgi:membrane-associated phospholipid phosphatase